MKKNNIIPADANRPCDCCARKHRKLYITNGFWMGKTCTEDYKLFNYWKNVDDIVWMGCEKKYWKVAAMYGKTSNGGENLNPWSES